MGYVSELMGRNLAALWRRSIATLVLDLPHLSSM